MKRTDLIRQIEKAGCTLARHGGKHDWLYESENRNVAAGASP